MSLFAGSAMAEGEKLIIGTEGAYPPFNNLEADGTLTGFDIDIARALCDEMKVTCEFVTNDWDGIIPGLMADKYDAIVASMSITEERKQQIDFTDKYYTTPLAVIAPKDGEVKGVSAEELKGKVVGAQASTTQANYATDVYEKAGIEVKLYPTQEEAAADLQNGRIDALISDKFVVADWLNGDGKDCCVMVGDVPGTETEAGIGIRKGEDDLKQRFNAAIQAIVADGTYGKIVARYFPFDIY